MEDSSYKPLLFHGADQTPDLNLPENTYFIGVDDDHICVGTQINFLEMPEQIFCVKKLQLVVASRMLEVEETEHGHSYLIEFDRSFGRIRQTKALKYQKL